MREPTCPVQCIEGCPQHESTQQRGANGPLTLLPHKTQARHEKQHRSRTVNKTSLRGVEARSRRMRVQGEGSPQHESTQPGPLTLLPSRHRSKQSAKQVHESRGLGGSGHPGGSRGPAGGPGKTTQNTKNQKNGPELYG